MRMKRLNEREPRSDESGWAEAIEHIERLAEAEPSSKRILQKALDLSLRHTGAERAFIMVRDEHDYSPIAAIRMTSDDVSEAMGSPARSIVGHVLEERKALRVGDALHDLRLEAIASIRAQHIRSVLCVPLRAGGETFGAIYLDHTHETDQFDQQHETDLSQLAHRLALHVEIMRLKRHRVQPARRATAGARTTPASDRLAASTRALFPAILSQSPAMDDVFHRIAKFGPTEEPVLIVGETGVGKELIARAFQKISRRRDRVFIPVDCGTMNETLLASELFGHVKGAFTGADRDHDGLFEHADGGTLFLDEVPNMAPAIQVSLLRFLQEGEIRRVGESHPRKVDVRILAASNQSLENLVRTGEFREDLYYRLRVMEVYVPPLRDRREDIPLLAQAFFKEKALTKEPPAVDQNVYEVLRRHDWPGNVRELHSVVRELALRADKRVTAVLARSALDDRGIHATGSIALAELRNLNLKRARHALERSLIREALRSASGNRERAAKLLGVDRSSFYRLAKERGVDTRRS